MGVGRSQSGASMVTRKDALTKVHSVSRVAANRQPTCETSKLLVEDLRMPKVTETCRETSVAIGRVGERVARERLSRDVCGDRERGSRGRV